ncbi:hypothetical protein BH20ACT4_BH20ACT4_13620 [soil metagenome]
MRLLLVEDEPRIASFVELALGAAGFVVEWVETGAAALDRAQVPDDRRPDVVVLDLGLPDIDGLDVLATLRASGCETPVIVLTARTESSERARAVELGIDDYIVKPFAIAELVASLPPVGSVRAT